MVHVPSHVRQRHNVVTVKTFASVSMTLPLQNGQSVGRVTAPVNCESGKVFTPFFLSSMLPAFCLFGCPRMNSPRFPQLGRDVQSSTDGD